MDTLTKFINPGIGFLATLIFGFWLSRAGKPYNGVLFNMHKLIALGTVVLTAVQIYSLLKGSHVQTLFILAVTGAVIGVMALFASGAFLSIGNLNYAAMKLVHNIALFLVVIGMGLAVYVLIGRTL
jgi:hypothetical protein